MKESQQTTFKSLDHLHAQLLLLHNYDDSEVPICRCFLKKNTEILQYMREERKREAVAYFSEDIL